MAGHRRRASDRPLPTAGAIRASGAWDAVSMKKQASAELGRVTAECLCGAVHLEIDYPARWAWHDHSFASRRAHGSAYATYVGSWRKRFRITKGARKIVRYEDKAAGTSRSFCGRCGTPLLYERARSPHMVNIPRALFQSRTGRQPLYHVGISELQDWTYMGGALVPLKGYPGVVWERPKRRHSRREDMFGDAPARPRRPSHRKNTQ